jgi:glucose/arabinose dehydrogenase
MSIPRSSLCLPRTLLSAALLPVLVATAAANQPPNAPIITQPATDGLTLNPADVHMETGPFSDPDPGDQHLCTDWQIWTVTPLQRVWYEDCATGVDRIHTHLGDGIFENSHAGRSELAANTSFLLRVRHSDDSGDPATQWSPWSQRTFVTGSAAQVYPLELQDVVPVPVPRWVLASNGINVILRPATTPPQLLLESAAGELLFAIQGNDGVTNTFTNPPALPNHVVARLQIQGGSQGLSLPPTDLLVVDDHCEAVRILLPAVSINVSSTNYYWISSAGATYVGTSSQTSPSFGMLARGFSPPWSPRRQGFHVEVFAGGLKLPVNLAFVPNPGPNPTDPFLYVTELYGKIKVVTRDRTVSDYASGLLNFNPTGAFPGSGEQGLTGLAVDPATGDVYATMLYASAANASIHYPKIVRFTSHDGGLSAASQTTILDMVNETQGQSHQVSNLTMTPDGKLLCHMGDGFNFTTAQDLESFRGKILRLNLDGTPASDNPFYDAGDGISPRDYVFAYGVRNPFGGDWRFSDGLQYEVENGPSVDRFAQIVPGRNFGWDGSDASMSNFAIYNWSPAHGPVNLAFVQPGTFGGSGFPASVMGHAFVSESGPTYAAGQQAEGKRITEWILDASGNLVAGPIPFLEYAGNGKATACGLEAGPDGLYMTELYYDQGSAATQPGARILRIYFDPAGDCNANSIDDVCDILNGASTDANANWIPDECESSAVPFCFGDGTGIPCPCGNTGLSGHGCSNSSTGNGGALLAGSGGALVSADTLRLTSSGERPTSLSVFWQGDAETAERVFGDGLGCLGGHLKRLYFHNAVGGTVIGPQGSDLSVSARSAALGDPIAPGTIRVYHVFYRDPDPNFCAAPLGSTFNTTNGLRVLWGG